MRRTATLLALIALLLTLTFALQNNTSLRELRAEVARLEQKIESERSRIAVLRVDYANITRIERLEKLTKNLLPHLRKAKTQQVRVIEAQNVEEEIRAAEKPKVEKPQALNYEAIRQNQ